MDKVFQALASEHRRKILAYLSEASLNAGEIAARFSMAKPTISKHLEILENAGLVKSVKVGQFVNYSIVRESLVANLSDFIAGFCPIGGPLKKESTELAKEKQNEKAS